MDLPEGLNLTLAPLRACVPSLSAVRVFTSATIFPWDPATLGTVPIIAIIPSTLTKMLPFPPGFMYPGWTPTVRPPLLQTGSRSELITGAEILALLATQPCFALRNRPNPLTFDRHLHRRAASPLWWITASNARLESDHFQACLESTHYLDIATAMCTSDLDHLQYHHNRQANLAQPAANFPESTDLITTLVECDQANPWRNHFRDHPVNHSSLLIPRLANKFNPPAALTPP
ncbi:hypothetical protein PHMEG_00016274 [Phytophthora megakarya]|uniref:Uncharacterized protein n=1 Tax=Phytophthora megakarya TaxID=4795 RepID=A0A225VZ79_9STRA|nr:hypothetical protein PHMEG_00016274 [Phytophthora megakarya]